MLVTQLDANGTRFPSKKDSTRKIYRAHGWNENQWLIRTGQATVVRYTNTPKGFRAEPTDPEDILKYVARSDDWFILNQRIQQDIIEQIKKDLK